MGLYRGRWDEEVLRSRVDVFFCFIVFVSCTIRHFLDLLISILFFGSLRFGPRGH